MSSITYKRGARCGHLNCPSTLWRVLDGQRVCQYGHIKEGDLEIADEDDDAFLNLGRRMNVPGLGSHANAAGIVKGDAEGVWYGKEGSALYMQCLQLILRTQVRWLIDTKGVRPELEGVVKDLWSLYITRTNFAKTKFDHNLDDIDSDADNRDHDELLDAINPFHSGEEDASESEDLPHKERRRPTRVVVVELAQLLDMPILCYLGCLLIKCPVYLGDIHRWIQQFQMPHMKCLRLIPQNLRQHLAGGYHNALTPMRVPRSGELLTETRKLLIYFDGTFNMKFPPPLVQPLLLKVLRGLFLPVELYVAVERLIDTLKIDLGISLHSEVKANQIWPETMIVALVIFCVKLCYGFDDIQRVPLRDVKKPEISRSTTGTPETVEIPETTEILAPPREAAAEPTTAQFVELAAYAPDWNLWMDMVRKVWIEDESLGEVDEKELPFWAPAQVDRYLDWFEDNFVEPDATTESALSQRGKKANQAMSLKRLLDLFPTELDETTTTTTATTRKETRKSKRTKTSNQNNDSLDYTAHETLNEIGQIITATTQVKPQSSKTPSVPTLATKSKRQAPLVLTPGARYPIYTAGVMRIPTPLEILFQAAEKMTAIPSTVLRASVVSLERRCKKYTRG